MGPSTAAQCFALSWRSNSVTLLKPREHEHQKEEWELGAGEHSCIHCVLEEVGERPAVGDYYSAESSPSIQSADTPPEATLQVACLRQST